MQTLAPQLKVKASVIDSFAQILNYEEVVNNTGSKMKQFFHTGVITKQIVEAKYGNLTNVFKGKPDEKSMQYVELAFFPIIAHEHFYLVVFNLSKGTSVIIDNSNSGQTYDSKYQKKCDVLKKLFSRYLESYKHPKASEIMTKKTTIMKLKWGTKQNVVDCCIFVMMHMEQYDGEATKNWKLEFPKEGKEQELEIMRMRIKYATKMLMHELNIHREKIGEETHQFAKTHTNKALKQKLIREEIDKKKEEQAREHVASAI